MREQEEAGGDLLRKVIPRSEGGRQKRKKRGEQSLA